MLTNTIGGVVSYRLGGKLSILLNTGMKVRLDLPKSTLELGDECQVAFNHETGKVAQVYAANTTIPDESKEMPPTKPEVPNFEDCPTFKDLGSVLGDRGLMEYLE